jgi:hypothetical protein
MTMTADAAAYALADAAAAALASETVVCSDCLMAAAGYTAEELGTVPEYTPLTRLADFIVVPCDGEGHFSNYPCDGCESPLAGDRYSVILMCR